MSLILVGSDLRPERVRVLLEDLRDGLRANVLVLAIVFAICAMAINSAILTAGETLAIQLEAL